MLYNPYTPGAGMTPNFLAGRDSTLKDAENILHHLLNGYPKQSVIYYGLRGVGKTVLLNQIEETTDSLNILFEHIEVSENDSFKRIISTKAKKLIHKMSVFSTAKDYFIKAISVLKAFNITLSAENGDLNLGLNEDILAAIGTADTGDFQDDLTELLISIGAFAQKCNKQICIFIDEIQYLKDNEFEALISAVHRVNQKRLPILIFGAGLPQIAKMAGDIKSYSERLFQFYPIGSLDYMDAKAALIEPAKKQNIYYTDEAVDRIFQITDGYPYFIQEFGKQAWDFIVDDLITADAVLKTLPKFQKSLDESFFKVRFDRATHKEREFMYAMVQCGDLPCTISQVAINMNTSVKSISPIRGQLIHKGFIYATGHGEIDFTVPQFDQYLKRNNSDL